MPRYIDAENMFKCETCRHCRGEYKCNTFCDSGESYSPNMSKIPTADVAEVKRGEWIKQSGARIGKRGMADNMDIHKKGENQMKNCYLLMSMLITLFIFYLYVIARCV